MIRALRTFRCPATFALVACLTAGCSMFSMTKPGAPATSATAASTDSTPIDSLNYSTAKISYKLDAGRLNLPLSVMRVEHQQVSYDQVLSPTAPERSTATVSIEYPHPEAPPGYARAWIVLASHSRPKPLQAVQPAAPAAKPVQSGWHYEGSWAKSPGAAAAAPAPAAVVEKDPPDTQEVWVLDLPKADLDLMMEILRRQNYFVGSTGIDGGTEITAKLNGRELKKPWGQVPELGVLGLRVRMEGQLISYLRPPVAMRMPPAMPVLSMYPQQPPLGPGLATAMTPPGTVR